jgi:hypothetical protein
MSAAAAEVFSDIQNYGVERDRDVFDLPLSGFMARSLQREREREINQRENVHTPGPRDERDREMTLRDRDGSRVEALGIPSRPFAAYFERESVAEPSRRSNVNARGYGESAGIRERDWVSDTSLSRQFASSLARGAERERNDRTLDR